MIKDLEPVRIYELSIYEATDGDPLERNKLFWTYESASRELEKEKKKFLEEIGKKEDAKGIKEDEKGSFVYEDTFHYFVMLIIEKEIND